MNRPTANLARTGNYSPAHFKWAEAAFTDSAQWRWRGSGWRILWATTWQQHWWSICVGSPSTQQLILELNPRKLKVLLLPHRSQEIFDTNILTRNEICFTLIWIIRRTNIHLDSFIKTLVHVHIWIHFHVKKTHAILMELQWESSDMMEMEPQF